MPVVGHAFYGVATAISVRPKHRVRPARLQTMWVGLAVVLAYVPDLANYALRFLGVQNARVVSHSLLFAVVAAAVYGIGMAAISGTSMGTMFGFALFSIASHDLLDLLQATDRVPLWPLSNREFGLGFSLISSNLLLECGVFGGVFVVFVSAWHWRHPGELRAMWQSMRSGWATYALIAVVLAFALTTDYLRDRRDDDLEHAVVMTERGDYRAALYYAQQAERWPATAREAHLLTVKGEAYEKLGNDTLAEQMYLRAHALDSSYFYAVANLALLYARSDLPLESRRHIVRPWIAILRGREFREEPDLPVTLRSLELHLGYKTGALSSAIQELN